MVAFAKDLRASGLSTKRVHRSPQRNLGTVLCEAIGLPRSRDHEFCPGEADGHRWLVGGPKLNPRLVCLRPGQSTKSRGVCQIHSCSVSLNQTTTPLLLKRGTCSCAKGGVQPFTALRWSSNAQSPSGSWFLGKWIVKCIVKCSRTRTGSNGWMCAFRIFRQLQSAIGSSSSGIYSRENILSTVEIG